MIESFGLVAGAAANVGPAEPIVSAPEAIASLDARGEAAAAQEK
jgi:hypothetical protein